MAPVLGGISDIRDIASTLKPDLIVSGLADARDRMPIAEMVDLRYSGCRIEEAGIACELILPARFCPRSAPVPYAVYAGF